SFRSHRDAFTSIKGDCDVSGFRLKATASAIDSVLSASVLSGAGDRDVEAGRNAGPAHNGASKWAVCASSVAGALTLCSGTAGAQVDAQSGLATNPMEEIVATGSRIARDGFS